MNPAPLHLDAEALAALAPEIEVRRGLQVHQEHRVSELAFTAAEEASAASHLLTRTDGVSRILVVCPTSLKHHWAREIKTFTDHSQTVLGSRLEQVVAAGGGLVAVVSAVGPEDKDAVASIEAPVPLVLLARRAWRSGACRRCRCRW